ncbi:MFS general substrate transporter [Mycena pura]|uniref:MFS general substrate transporter n=1 Tax=Mycena pura TaxID=153505 RepID=A0AAD6VPI5_9AGAR|nr:MFS general substrate transporter [Mycena pura]
MSEKLAEITPTAVAASESSPQSAPETPSRGQILLCRVQTAVLIWAVFLAGWNDGTLGPLIPRIQKVYHLGYLVVALLFVFQALVRVPGSYLTVSFRTKIGFDYRRNHDYIFYTENRFRKGPCFQVVGYSLQAAALPYPVFAFASVLNGIGVSILDAQANGYVASIARSPEARMGYTQAAYGAGIFAAPLVSTQFAQQHHWSFHYLVSLGITLSNILLLTLVFHAKPQNECLAQLGQTGVSAGFSRRSHMRQMFSLSAVHLMALFLFVHVGVGVTNSGWTVTYMLNVRGGGASAGYIAAGYAGGVVLGRIALIPLNKLVGESRIVYIYGLVAIGLQLVVWLVPSLIGGAVAIAFGGLVSGPIYPLALNRAAKLFPPWLLTATMSWMAAMATVGGAVVPFIAGAISSRVGIKSIQPVIVAGMALMLVLWTIVPKHLEPPRRNQQTSESPSSPRS